jgi:hypothetical protein
MSKKITVKMLKPITPVGWGSPFHPQSSKIVYDSKSPIKKKMHQLIHQQGPRYGTIGDACTYLNHDELLALELSGHIRIVSR